MWTHEELLTRDTWNVDDLPPEIKALINSLDLACMADDGELDRGLMLYLADEAVYEWPEPGTPEWVQAAIEANPGIWIARLCRAMHSHEENLRSVAYCGQCGGGYANKRKRLRAANLQKAVLPGFEEIGGAFHLHHPCGRRDFTWLRRQVNRLVEGGLVIKRREKRPDMRQARNWDYMSCLYPAKERTEQWQTKKQPNADD